MSDSLQILCPYCGELQPTALQCRSCSGRFDAWSLRATQNDMGAWFVRDPRQPHFVGLRAEAVVAAIRSGQIGPRAIVRGPTTRQLWTIARRVPGIAHLFGRCYRCQSPVLEVDLRCKACGTDVAGATDRNFLGLPPQESVDPPRDARPDLSAFVEDSRTLFVGITPVRAADPGIARDPRPATPLLESAPTRTANAEDPRPATSPQPAVARSAISPIDRALIERSRRLERVNRVLFASTGLAVVIAVILTVAYARQRDGHAKELAAARAAGAAEVRADFIRTEPVVPPPPATLPPMPTDPGAERAKSPAAASPTSPAPTSPAPTSPAPTSPAGSASEARPR